MRISQIIKEHSHRIPYVTSSTNIISGIVKIIAAISVSSELLAISGLYNFALCISKIPYIRWKRENKNYNFTIYQTSHIQSLIIMSSTILILGILFIFFSVKMLLIGENITYNDYSVYALAACSFTKLGMSIYWIIILKRKNNPIDFTMKLTNFADALVSIALTQSAMLTMQHVEKAAYYDGVFGLIIGITVLIIGCISLIFSIVTKHHLDNKP